MYRIIKHIWPPGIDGSLYELQKWSVTAMSWYMIKTNQNLKVIHNHMQQYNVSQDIELIECYNHI